MLKYILAACLLATPCLAQQQPQLSPPETALQINSIVGLWAQTLVNQGKLIDDLQKQLATAQARIKELEQKPDDRIKKQ